MKAAWWAVCILFMLTGTAFGQSTRQVRIGVMLDADGPEVVPLIQATRAEIIAVVGEDATIIYPEKYQLASGYDLEKARLNYQTLIEGDVDIILAFGPVTNKIVSSQTVHKKPTVLFGAIPSDYIKLDTDRSTSGIDNLVYLVTSQSFRKDLTAFRQLYPYQTVGIAVEKPLMSVIDFVPLCDSLHAEEDISYKLIPFTSVDEIVDQLEGVDALYLGGGFLLPDLAIERLADELYTRKIPSFTSTSVEDVELGLMATDQRSESIDQFIRRIALSVESIINGTNAADLPLYIDSREEMTINFNTADAVGVPIRYSLIATTNFVGDFVNVRAERTYNLKEVMQEVITDNLGLQVSQKDVEVAGQEVKTARSNYLPDVTLAGSGTYTDPNLASVSNGQNPEFQTAGSVILTQTIFAPGASANIRIQEQLRDAQEASYSTDQLNSIFDAANAYLNVLLFKANLSIAATNVDLTKENMEIASHNYESGQSGKGDLLRFRSQMAQNTQALVEAVNQLEQAFIQLNQLLNQPVSREIDVEEAILGEGIFKGYNYEELSEFLDNPELREPFIRFLISKAKANAPELRNIRFNQAAVSERYKLANTGRYLPSVALQAQYNRILDRSGAGSETPPGFGEIPNSNYSLGVNVSLPLFQQNQQNINRQTAVIQQEQLLYTEQNINLSLDQNVSVAVLQMINQIANIQLAKISQETARESLELAIESFRAGAVNRVQLIDAQTNFINAQLANASAVYNYLISALQIERFIGYYFLLHSEAENEAFRQEFFGYLSTKNQD